MKVALTGATGYTGGRLLSVLTGRGDTVRALARRSSKRPELSPAPTWIEGDLGEGVAFLPKPSTQETLAHLVQKLLLGPASSVSVLYRLTEPERRKAAGEERGIEP